MPELPVKTHQDQAGNLWATLKGQSPKTLLIGGHFDSVPNGGWLDGCLNVLAGVEVLRRITAQGTPPVTVRLVDWCDEEGARFGRSLFGSSAVSGALVPDEVRNLTDRDGIRLEDAVSMQGIDLNHVLEAKKELANAAAYLELHIEQGPVLESMNLPMGVVLGTFGVERHGITFTGQAAHSGSTPMNHRRDALGGVSKLHLAVREIAVKHGGVCTVGKVTTKPGIVTAVVGEAEMTLDQRHLDAKTHQRRCMAMRRKRASESRARKKSKVTWKKIWQIQPFPFHPDLIHLGDEAIKEILRHLHRTSPAAGPTTPPKSARPAYRRSCSSCKACAAFPTQQDRGHQKEEHIRNRCVRSIDPPWRRRPSQMDQSIGTTFEQKQRSIRTAIFLISARRASSLRVSVR